MLRSNFSRKMNIDTILKYLELATKFVAIMIIVATVIGGLNIYSYLKDIDHLFLFSDVVGISYASISALVSYFLFVFMVSLGFLSPFIIPVFLLLISNDNNENNNPENKTANKNQQPVFNPSQKLLGFKKKIASLLQFIILCTSPIYIAFIPLLPIILSIFIICYLPIYILNFLVRELFFGKERDLSFIILSKFVHWVSFLCVIDITLIVFFGNDFLKIFLHGIAIFFIAISFLYTRLFIKNIYNEKVLVSEKLIFIILLSFSSIFPSILHFLFVVYPTVNVVKYEITSILFYILSIFLFGLSCFLSHSTIYDYFQDKMFFRDKKYDGKLIIVNFIPIFIYVLYLSYFSDYNMSLYAPRFIEKPTNSSWYLIHNGNTTSETINGLNKHDIKKQKELFNVDECEKYKKECNSDKQAVFKKRENALYGYMAWNLGNTKVFCPQSVDFFKTNNQNERNVMSQKCLVIDGKYLQLVSEYYLKQPTE